MALVFLIGDLPEALRDQTAVMTDIATALHQNNDLLCRIAEALERTDPTKTTPHVPAVDGDGSGHFTYGNAPRNGPLGKPIQRDDTPQRFSMAESPEEHQERTSKEAALALSLGVAPWSPDFQNAINDMRQEVLRSPKIETDGEGKEIGRRQYTEDEADEIVRESFRLAKAAANQRE